MNRVSPWLSQLVSERAKAERLHVAKMLAAKVYFVMENNFGVTPDDILAELSSDRFKNHWEVTASTPEEALHVLATCVEALGITLPTSYFCSPLSLPWCWAEMADALYKWTKNRMDG